MAFGAHPDDCELVIGGTLAALKDAGHKVGVCDLTRGEAGTYGSVETRAQELKRATEILGLDARETLDVPDGKVLNTEENRMKVVKVIRQYRPRLILAFVGNTRHPDHGCSGALVKDASFIAGLKKIETGQDAYRPARILTFPELKFDIPDIVVDVTKYWDIKMAAIRAYGSQIIQEGEDDRDTETLVRSHAFLDIIEARSSYAGGMINAKYGEPFFVDRPVAIDDLVEVFGKKPVR